MASFDFDCPCHFINLSGEINSSYNHSEPGIEKWWELSHSISMPLSELMKKETPFHNPSPHSSSKAGSTNVSSSIHSRSSSRILKSAGREQQNVRATAETTRSSNKEGTSSSKSSISSSKVSDFVKAKPETVSAGRRVIKQKLVEEVPENNTPKRKKVVATPAISKELPKTVSVSTIPPPPPSRIIYAPTKVANSSAPGSVVAKRQPSSAGVKPSSKTGSSSSSSSLRQLNAAAPTDMDDDNLLAMLRKHNQKFVPTPKYVPSMHSVRDVRMWEKISGKIWSSLDPEERELANKEIAAMKNS